MGIHNKFYYQSQNASAKISLIMLSTMIDAFEAKAQRSSGWRRLKEIKWQVSQLGFWFHPNNFFFHNVDNVVQWWTATGVMNKIIQNQIGSRYRYVTSKRPQVLTMESLSFGFNIWLGFCALSVVAFIFELFWSKNRWMRKNVIVKFAKVYTRNFSELTTKIRNNYLNWARTGRMNIR